MEAQIASASQPFPRQNKKRKKKKTLTSTARRVLRTEIGVWSKNSPAPRRYIRSAFKVSAKKQTRSIAVTKT